MFENQQTLPRLDSLPEFPEVIEHFAQKLKSNGFAGDIELSQAARLCAATDNSIYQLLPQAVLHPRKRSDVGLIMTLANEEEFLELSFTARGGGTGTNGQSLNVGIIIDLSRYMANILEIQVQERWVRVQPGVVLDQLNDAVKPYGLFFAPSLSPSNRATIGGMIATDACGEGSRLYGRTSEHVLELRTVLADGSEIHSRPIRGHELLDQKQKKDSTATVLQSVEALLRRNQTLIEESFPKLDRFLTGYNLAHAWDAEKESLNLNALICGAEGTLGIVTEAKLKLIPLPSCKRMVLIRYGTFEDALASADELLHWNPSSIETIDDRVLSLARGDSVFEKVGHLLEPAVLDASPSNLSQIELNASLDLHLKIDAKSNSSCQAINLVEFTGDNADELENTVKKLSDILREKSHNSDGLSNSLGHYITKNDSEREALWELRKKGVGLLAKTPGRKKPMPFIEDTAVPPSQLCAYVSELRKLLKENGLQFAMYGHVDVGCLHVRPCMDFQNLEDEKRLRNLTDQVHALVRKFGGLLWAEHGKGFRSEYAPDYFGKELYQEVRRIKGIFDPQNRLNPGKVASPLVGTQEKGFLYPLESPLRAHRDKQIDGDIQDEYHDAMDCNGNGLCFHYKSNTVMCPSYHVTRNRIESPKGRAGLVREWLRQLESQGFRPNLSAHLYLVNNQSLLKNLALRSVALFKRSWRTIQLKQGVYDFSAEVHQSMQSCLACKGCSGLCPVKADIPDLKARVSHFYYKRYLRPLRDYGVLWLERSLPYLSHFSGLINFLLKRAIVLKLIEGCFRIQNPPLLADKKALKEFEKLQVPLALRRNMDSIGEKALSNCVVLFQDGFTRFLDTEALSATVKLLRSLGYQVLLSPYLPSGKPLHVLGFLSAFQKVVEKNQLYLQWLAKYNVPLVCIEPSVALLFHDEYLKFSSSEFKSPRVYLLQEWLSTVLSKRKDLPGNITKPEKSNLEDTYYLLGHCSEKSMRPASEKQWAMVFNLLGLNLENVSVGCCGMAGVFGHLSEQQENSKKLFEMDWAAKLKTHGEHALATGYSCRTQSKRFQGQRPSHPSEILVKHLEERNRTIEASRMNNV